MADQANPFNADIPKDPLREGATDEAAADVREQIDKLNRDIAELTKALKAYGSNKVQDAADASQAALDSARASVASFEEDLEASIRARPIQAIAIAAGVGFLAALITRR